MIKILHMKIRNCLHCPLSELRNDNYMTCEYPDHYEAIKDPTALPDWCPLPDAKEEVK